MNSKTLCIYFNYILYLLYISNKNHIKLFCNIEYYIQVTFEKLNLEIKIILNTKIAVKILRFSYKSFKFASNETKWK